MALVRTATTQDATLIAVLTRQCWLDSAPTDSRAHRDDEASVLKHLQSGGGLVLEHANLPVGSVRWRELGSVWEIGRLGVLPHYRRSGHATRLMREVEALAASRGVPEVRVAVRHDASLQLVQFYQRLGYAIDPTAVYSHSNPGNPAPIVMRRELLHAMGASA